jgi:hypothetical protein
MTSVVWRTSSYSNGTGGACVEVAALPTGHVMVRDTKDRTRPPARYSRAAWQAFIAAVKTGEFD